MITETDKKVIDFITKYYSDTGFYPNYQEIAEGMEWYSKATVFAHMKKIENEGIIIRKTHGSAQYRLTDMKFRIIESEQIGGKE